eukprot:CAMPEP_0203995984 /NCGR_PEP_ID=MMETSP0360-20130528/12442_1 /ASSEMBLY_ACC=CAM_ASM_000342 /TAXON_ID=268821 /ORGANISM="Scrippsiella Hangoei, Strain SHTV-5" /LENGTH=83 /DNA_ID=CAMNT_0050936747 /DNA_START=49 /DNA_END=296 /DNA_ORIENTATION=+
MKGRQRRNLLLVLLIGSQVAAAVTVVSRGPGASPVSSDSDGIEDAEAVIREAESVEGPPSISAPRSTGLLLTATAAAPAPAAA